MHTRKYLVNFATTASDGFRDFSAAQKRQILSARRFGIDNIISWNRQQLLQTDFYKKNKHILDCKRGAGYWLWKPFICSKQISEINEGDFLMYLDTGIEFVDNPTPLFEICSQTRGFFMVDKRGKRDVIKYWTKRDCFHYMHLDEPEFHNACMTSAGILIFQKNSETSQFISEWLNYCLDERIITDIPNQCGKPNLPGFIKHRHDMSILSLLRVKHGITGYRFPTQHGNHLKMKEYRVAGEWIGAPYSTQPCADSPYGTIFFIGRGIEKGEWFAQNPPYGEISLRRIRFVINKKIKKIGMWIKSKL